MAMRSFHALLILLLAASLLSGCAALFPPAPGTVLFSDSFDDNQSGWATWQGEDNFIFYDESGLHFFLQAAQYDLWSLAGRQFKDARIEVDADVLAGPLNNAFGILCRYVNKENFYAFVVSADGYYGIYKMKNGERIALTGGGKLEYKPELRQGRGERRLRAECVGIDLRFYVDDDLLASVVDADFTRGDVGLMVGSYDQPGIDIRFDNFTVIQP